MSRALLLFTAAVSLAFAPAPLTRRATKAPTLPSFLGSWSSDAQAQVTLVLTPTRLEYHNPGGHINGYDLTFDAGKAPPTYDISGQGKSNYSGIWRVEGDKLTMYYRVGVNNRP